MPLGVEVREKLIEGNKQMLVCAAQGVTLDG